MLTLFQLVIDSSYYRNLGNYLKDLFNNYVEKTAERAKTVCMEEFYSAKTLHWDMTELDLGKDELAERETLLNMMFERIKKRIIRNVITKSYNVLLLPFMYVLSTFKLTHLLGVRNCGMSSKVTSQLSQNNSWMSCLIENLLWKIWKMTWNTWQKHSKILLHKSKNYNRLHLNCK